MTGENRLFPQIVKGLKAEYTIDTIDQAKPPEERGPGDMQQGQYSIAYRTEKLKKGEMRPMTSRRDPEREAQRILRGFELKEGLIAVVFGACGLALLDRLNGMQKKQGGKILLFEADPVLLQKLAALFPEKFNLPHICIVTPPIPRAGYVLNSEPESTGILRVAVDQFFDSIAIEGVKGFRVFANPASAGLSPAFYRESETLFQQAFSTRISDLFTRLQFEPRWIANSLFNAGALSRAIAAKELFGVARSANALLVSTGPSLRGSLPWIRKNAGKFFIACVDSAYRVLVRSGIEPHLIFSLDSQAFTYKHFYGLPSGRAGEFPVLYADLVANPSIVSHWRGPLAMGLTAVVRDESREATVGSDYIEKQILGESPGDIQSGGSVATSLFDLLRQMGFSSITLIGQDLAYTYKEIHCMGTHHYDHWLSGSVNRLQSLENINYGVMLKRQIKKETSIRGNEIDSDYILNLYRKWFEAALHEMELYDSRNHKRRRGTPLVYNQTGDGLPVKGAGRLSDEDEKSLQKLSGTATGALLALMQRNGKEAKYAFSQRLLKNVARRMEQIGAEEAEQENFEFMSRIGRRFALRMQRRQEAVTEEEGKKLESFRLRERRIFWKILTRRFRRMVDNLVEI